MKPFTSPAQDRYCRLFPPAGPRLDPSGPEAGSLIASLRDLVCRMKDDSSVLAPVHRRTAMSAGYTYFGQFLDHDLTNDRSSLTDAWVLEPEEIPNGQAPRLDLGQIYGRGPWDRIDQRLYDGVRLKVGPRKAPGDSDSFAGNSFDIAIDEAGPLLADERATENAILRQLTAIFCRLHNLAVDQFAPDYHHEKALFQRARLHTAWQYQLLVGEDFLPRILERSVFEKVFRRREPSIEWSAFSIPVEFSVAAMRFGHSLVRNRYILSKRELQLREIMALGRQPTTLPRDTQIDWGRLVTNASRTAPSAITAEPIDTGIADALHGIPLRAVTWFSPVQPDALIPSGDTVPLPFLSFVRGAGLRLPCGQAVAEAFGETVLSARELTTTHDGVVTLQGKALSRHGFVARTPLLYYLLKESEVRCHGNRLGPTGSHIVAETIYGALLHDRNSILNHPGVDWCTSTDELIPGVTARPLWKLSAGTKPIHTFRELLSYSPGFPSA